MWTRTIHLHFPSLPSGLASYPRVVLTRRPDILQVAEPAEFQVRAPLAEVDDVELLADEMGEDGPGNFVAPFDLDFQGDRHFAVRLPFARHKQRD